MDCVCGHDEAFFYAAKGHDFGSVQTDGAIALRWNGSGLSIFQIIAPSGPIHLRLSQTPGLLVQPRGAIVRLHGTEVQEEAMPIVYLGDEELVFRAVADTSVVRYELKNTPEG